jgi:hypothetical protein
MTGAVRITNQELEQQAATLKGATMPNGLDVTASSTLENYPRDLCGEQPCVPLFSGIIAYPELKDQFIIVDVESETVVIDVSAASDKFDEFLPKAQKVLDSVEWKGA